MELKLPAEAVHCLIEKSWSASHRAGLNAYPEFHRVKMCLNYIDNKWYNYQRIPEFH